MLAEGSPAMYRMEFLRTGTLAKNVCDAAAQDRLS